MVGSEGLIRASFGPTEISPGELFAQQHCEQERLALDERCHALHMEHFKKQGRDGENWLFLNISAAMVVTGRYAAGGFKEALQDSGVDPSKVVVEILEDAIGSTDSLVDAVSYFRDLGCLIALDDFGTGHSNFERIWRLQPDITKLDCSIVAQAGIATGNRGKGKILRNLVSLMHEAGSLVLTEGVETEYEALRCFDADADFVQGFYFARPEFEHTPEQIADAECSLAAISHRFNQQETMAASRQRELIAPYEQAFRAAATALYTGDNKETAVTRVLEMPRTVRCYVLNQQGEQVTHHFAPERVIQEDPRFEPLVRTTGGTWFRRPYYRDAISDPNRLKVSAPYLSATGTLDFPRHHGVSPTPRSHLLKGRYRRDRTNVQSASDAGSTETVIGTHSAPVASRKS